MSERRPHGHDQNPYRDLGQGNQEVDDPRGHEFGRREDEADSDDESTREELRYNEDQEQRGR